MYIYLSISWYHYYFKLIFNFAKLVKNAPFSLSQNIWWMDSSLSLADIHKTSLTLFSYYIHVIVIYLLLTRGHIKITKQNQIRQFNAMMTSRYIDIEQNHNMRRRFRLFFPINGFHFELELFTLGFNPYYSFLSLVGINSCRPISDIFCIELFFTFFILKDFHNCEAFSAPNFL